MTLPKPPPVPAKPAPPHTLVSLRGRLGTAGQSPETWQMNVRGTGFVGTPATEAQIAEMVTASQNFVGNALFTDAVHLDELRISSQAANGHQTGDTLVVPAPANGSGGANIAYQLSLAVTLVAAGRGAGHLGRWYPPPTTLAPSNADGLISLSSLPAYLAHALDFVTAMNAAGLGVAIIGRTGSVGTARLVTAIRVGRVIDTQRRRRRSLKEAYIDAAVVG